VRGEATDAIRAAGAAGRRRGVVSHSCGLGLGQAGDEIPSGESDQLR
jgi:hypothetical protein